MAYRLQLSVSSRIHPVFHISLLKPHQGHLPETLAPLPPTATNHLPVIEPLSILDWKWDNSSSTPTKLVLVQCNGLAPEDTTWEQWDTLHTSYTTLGTRLFFRKGGIDSNCIIPEANSSNTRPKRAIRRPTYLNDYAWKHGPASTAVSYSVITIPLPLHYSVHYVCYCNNIYSVITVSVYSVGRIIHQHLRLVIHN